MAGGDKPLPKPTKKRGRPKGSKNRKTLVKEARAKAVSQAKKALTKTTPGKKGENLIDVAELCNEQGFDPVSEAIILYRELEANSLDPDANKLRIDLLKLIMPYYAPKKKPQVDDSTSNKRPYFYIQVGGNGSNAPAPVEGREVHVNLPDPDVVDVAPEEDN